MKQTLGFSLFEVLIALFILSFSFVSLLKYQWFLIKKEQQLSSDLNASLLLDNASERLLAKDKTLEKDFNRLAEKTLPKGRGELQSSSGLHVLTLSWQSNRVQKDKFSSFKRSL